MVEGIKRSQAEDPEEMNTNGTKLTSSRQSFNIAFSSEDKQVKIC